MAFMEQEALEDAGVDYADYRSELPENAKLLFYTDGLVEVSKRDDPTTQFGDVIDDVLIKLAPKEPRALLDDLLAELIAFCGREELPDDVCAICVAT
jgi:serine phosphatase RsbU (regulator of sigma subunit)